MWTKAVVQIMPSGYLGSTDHELRVVQDREPEAWLEPGPRECGEA